MISRSNHPLPGSVFSPTVMPRIAETFVSLSMRDDLPPCELVEADFDGITAIVEDLGPGDDGRPRRECTIRAGGVCSDFGHLEHQGFAPDDSVFGSRKVDARTIERIRRWSVGHGMPDLGPARSA